ncbi:DUF1349 domain-containing protein [Paenibacillus dendritiformis]|uniref:DUF1349 domain-containing protein n=1 Tax=Paenibacillus dendritiformis TaxID=130049 RepID=UPI001059BB6B|nr:DUF1349 domain-containing protein [Paenibacillus dendritiformis]TDL48837.1 DUF1349 domain-containing protein [Paenibacillus dendritiformis]
MNHLLLHENFRDERLNVNLNWFSPPKAWSIDTSSSQFIVQTKQETDFWQKTHYGFQADNGHFLYAEVRGNFRLTTKVHSFPVHRYDQAGVMVRYSPTTWMKSSVEYIPDSPNKLGAVVTNHGYSDWSTQEAEDGDAPLYFRISRIGDDFYADYSLDGLAWRQLRMAHLFAQADQPVQAGIYACSPQGEGYEAHFEFLRIEALSDDRTQVYT